MKIIKEVSFDEIMEEAANKTIFYGAQTCWWSDNPAHLHKKHSGLPCDPQGGVLFQTQDGMAKDWLRQAKEQPWHYGVYGIRALMAAYHGCIVDDEGNPTTVSTWDVVTELLDKYDEKQKD